MSQQNPTIIVGHLDDSELTKSIDKLVNEVANKTTTMAGHFTTAIGKMQDAMKDFAITQKVSVDLMKEAWRDMSKSFDAMVAAQEGATRGGSGKATKSGGLGVNELRSQISNLDTEIKALGDKSREFLNIRDRVILYKNALRGYRADVQSYDYRMSRGEVLSKTDMMLYEEAKKKVESFTKEINSLLAQRHTIPAPTKEDIQRYNELIQKREELNKALNKAMSPETVGDLKNQITIEDKYRDSLRLGTQELKDQNELIAQQKARKKEELMTEEEKLKFQQKQTEQLERQKAKELKKAQSPYLKEFNAANTMSTRELTLAEAKLVRLQNIQRTMQHSGLFDEAQINRVQKAIDNVTNKITKLRNAKPKSLDDVLGMDAKSIDQIAAKMRALKMVRIDPNNAAEVKRVGDAYAELKRKQAQLMGQNIQLTHSNNYLAQSFGYIRNRIVYALTLGAVTNFVKQLYEIRGQYELLERSLGVLVGSFEKGTQIFNELNEMAIKSPFTLIELGTAAKQLTAYNFAANEVVDTTRRLADISAALGVPMERLTYNLGQIKAQGVLNARDARDFANAGLAIVPMLAKMYTEQKTFGDEMVTTAKVYDMMSKKMVTYSDVLKVLYQVTDEGGKFFDFQAKQADTLRVQMANLTLAYNNMLNEIGSENQGLLTAWVSGLKTLLKNWKEISRAILTLVTTLGTYKAVATIVSALNSRMFVGSVLVGLRNYILGIKNATGAMATFNAVTKANPIAFLISALVAAIGYFALFNHKVKETTVEMERFGENASKQIKKVETLGKVLAGIEEGSSTYKKALSELNQIVSEYGVTEIKNRDEINSKIQQTIQLIKEEGKERQYANNIAKGEERYLNATGEAKTSLNEGLLGLEGWFGTTSKVRKEILDNTEAITDVASSIIEENIGLIVNKTGQEAYDGLIEIQNRVRSGLKNSGLSESAIDFILNKGYISAAIKDYRIAAEEHERYNQKIKGYYDAATKATQSTMTFTEKINANARALRNNTEDAVSLYNRVYDIVKIAKENHVINFDLKLSAEKPPKWMLDKSLPELQQLAERFTAIAQSGGHAKGYDRESTYERGLMYASAARIKQEEEERNARNKDTKTRTKQSDEIAKAIKNEISLVKELQSAYDTLTKKGDSHANAIAKVQDLYGKTIDLLNKDMDKFGLPRLDLSIIKGNNHNEVLAFFEKLRDVLESKGLSNIERMEAVEGVVKEFRLKADTYNLDMITKGLNNELGKLKDEYELAVELDANPELGGMFADWMDIDVNDLPRTAKEYAERASNELNKYLKQNKADVELPNLLNVTDDDLRAFKENKILTDEQLEIVRKVVQQARDIHKKEVSDQINDWDKLLEKYAEYEYKVTQIQKEAEREREIARKKGASQDVFDAINNRERQEIARVGFEEFQKSPEWIAATGDLAGMTSKAIGYLINSLERYKKAAKNLNPKQIKQINSALKNLHKQQRQGNPFLQIADAIDKAKARAEEFQPEMDAVMSDIIALEEEIGDNDPTEEQAKHIQTLKERWKDLAAQGDVSATEYVEAINASISAASEAITMFTNMADALGGKHMTQATQTIKDVVGVLQQAGQGAAMGAQIGGGWGALIGGVAGGLAGVITTFADKWSGNAGITEKINSSERAVRQLELSYIDLEQAVNKAMGAAVIGAKQATIANKELQLAEIKRQIELEKSRSSKNRDEDKVIDLQKQYRELYYEIKNGYTELVDDLMGTDASGFAENLVSSMINAFKQGEDYMKVFSDKFDEMIDNMIMKSIVSRVVSSYLNKIWDSVDQRIRERSEKESEDYANMQNTNVQVKELSDEEIRKAIAVSRANGKAANMWEFIEILNSVTQKDIEEYRRAAEAEEKAAKERFDAATEFTNSDIDYVLSQITGVMPELGEKLKEILGEYYKFGESSDKNLSALQQGIGQISENTAESLEAYMNGVSQQVYLQSDLLTQIRDAVVGMDIDVQVATQAQMLLQLQQSYTVQMAIQGILEGVLNPSGRAFSVELVS